MDGTVTLRRYGHEKQDTMTVEAFEKWLVEKISTRSKE
jgi:hypothetical protein